MPHSTEVSRGAGTGQRGLVAIALRHSLEQPNAQKSHMKDYSPSADDRKVGGKGRRPPLYGPGSSTGVRGGRRSPRSNAGTVQQNTEKSGGVSLSMTQ